MPIVYVVTLEDGKRKVVELDTDNLGSATSCDDIDGGNAMEVYQTDDCIDGGDANG